MLKLKLQYTVHLMRRTDSLEKTLILGKIEGRRRREDRGWDGSMALPHWWTWVWASSGSWWWTRKPGLLQSMALQTAGHNWTEQNWILTADSFGHNLPAVIVVQSGKFDTEADPCTYWHFGVFCFFFFFWTSGRFRTSDARGHTTCFSNPFCMCVCAQFWLFATLWTVAHLAPLPVGFSRQEYWNELPFPTPRDLPDPGIGPGSPALQTDSLPSEPPLRCFFYRAKCKISKSLMEKKRRLEHICHSYALQKEGLGWEKTQSKSDPQFSRSFVSDSLWS